MSFREIKSHFDNGEIAAVNIFRTLKSAGLFLMLAWLIYTPCAMAQTQIDDLSGSQYLVQVLLGLGVVVILIFVLAWGLKWVNQLNGLPAHKAIKILSQTPIGIKEKLVVIEVADKQLLLGLTANNISLLHSFEAGEISSDDNAQDDSHQDKVNSTSSQSFSQLYKKISGRS